MRHVQLEKLLGSENERLEAEHVTWLGWASLESPNDRSPDLRNKLVGRKQIGWGSSMCYQQYDVSLSEQTSQN